MSDETIIEPVSEVLGGSTVKSESYRVGNARLVFGEVAFEPGAPFTDLGLLTSQQLQTFFDSGHLIRIEESA